MVVNVIRDAMHWLTWLAVTSYVAIVAASSDVPDCPDVCRCIEKGAGVVTACINQNLTSIPEGIPVSTRALYLKENKFSVLRENSFTGLASLQNLALTHCHIENIEPNAFTGLRNLTSLDLRWNKIRQLQAYTFSGLFHMKRLELDNNAIEAIHNFAFHGLNLTRLTLEANPKLGEIAQKAFYSAKVQELTIHNAILSSQSLHALRELSGSLKELGWRNNQKPITVPEDLFQGFSFRSLNLDGNKIDNVQFLSQVITDDLSLEDNPIGVVDFSRYPNLREIRSLHMGNTGMHSLNPQHFSGMTHLRQLYIENNGITTLSSQLEPLFDGLQRLVMNDNPLHCNCEVLWLRRWVQSAKAIVVGADCTTPIGDNIVLVDEEAFTCTKPSNLNITRVTDPDTKEVILRCSAQGDPPPSVFWYSPDDNIVSASPAENRSLRHNTGDLVIDSSMKGESGTYKCVADNNQGEIEGVTKVDVYSIISASGDNNSNAACGSLLKYPYSMLFILLFAIASLCSF